MWVFIVGIPVTAFLVFILFKWIIIEVRQKSIYEITHDLKDKQFENFKDAITGLDRIKRYQNDRRNRIPIDWNDIRVRRKKGKINLRKTTDKDDSV